MVDARTGQAVGRPRDSSVTARVVAAALDLFSKVGYDKVTMAAVAREASVGLDTIYRRWPSKQGLLVDVVSRAIDTELPTADSGDVTTDLCRLGTGLAQSVRGEFGAALAIAIGQAALDPVLLQQLATAQANRRAATSEVLRRAVSRGQLPTTTDIDLVLDLLSGLVWHRAFVSDTALDDEAIRSAVLLVLAGVRAG